MVSLHASVDIQAARLLRAGGRGTRRHRALPAHRRGLLGLGYHREGRLLLPFDLQGLPLCRELLGPRALALPGSALEVLDLFSDFLLGLLLLRLGVCEPSEVPIDLLRGLAERLHLFRLLLLEELLRLLGRLLLLLLLLFERLFRLLGCLFRGGLLALELSYLRLLLDLRCERLDTLVQVDATGLRIGCLAHQLPRRDAGVADLRESLHLLLARLLHL